MKIFNSIKWRLQIWYGLILVAVLAGLGFTAYQLEWGRQMGNVDDELHRRFAILAEVSHPHPHGPGGQGMPMDGLPGQPPDDGFGQMQPGEGFSRVGAKAMIFICRRRLLDYLMLMIRMDIISWSRRTMEKRSRVVGMFQRQL